MRTSLKELTASGTVITDGAWGTQLQERGLEVGACPDGWNLPLSTVPHNKASVAKVVIPACFRPESGKTAWIPASAGVTQGTWTLICVDAYLAWPFRWPFGNSKLEKGPFR